MVILASNAQPYQEALAGFNEGFKGPIRVCILSEGKPGISAETRVIVAIGEKAALYNYGRPQTLFIYCLAPAVEVRPRLHPGGLVRVHVAPPPDILLRKLRDLQPTLKRLQMLWMSEIAVNYAIALKSEGERIGLTVIPERARSLDELPRRLRAMKGRVQAIWLPPDPLLIIPESFETMRRFSWDNDIPLYVSVDTLADQGATASIAVSFREMGRKAGALAAQALSASVHKFDSAYYGDKVSVTLSLKSAAEAGLALPAPVLEHADRILP